MNRLAPTLTAAALALLALAGCGQAPSPNDASCKIFANSYNAYVDAGHTLTSATANVNTAGEGATAYRASIAAMPGDFADAYTKATGDVAVALRDAHTAAQLFEQAMSTGASKTTKDSAITALVLSASDAADKCKADGVSIAISR